MSANLENSAVAIGLEKVSFFILIPKKSNAKECSNYHTIALICSKSFKLGFSSIWIRNFPMYKLHLDKLEEPEIKLPTFTGSQRKQENSKNASISASLTMLKPLTVWITTNWKIFKEMVIPDHLTCLLRNLYAEQEARVRTLHGTTDWFKIGKAVHQGCVYCHPASLTYVQGTWCKMPGWMITSCNQDWGEKYQ